MVTAAMRLTLKMAETVFGNIQTASKRWQAIWAGDVLKSRSPILLPSVWRGEADKILIPTLDLRL